MLGDRGKAPTAPGPVAPDEFQHLVDPYQQELLVHCYRFFGSLDDAEDALQETLLRAWRRFDTLKEPASLRAWLYKIATNASLDLLDRFKVRALPAQKFPSADPDAPLPDPIQDPVWLEPLPDEYLDRQNLNPEARYEARESVTLAFLALLQKLPGRQRAVLILRDVLGWKAHEVAGMLDLSTAAVNSALQRARATIQKHQANEVFSIHPVVEDSHTAALLDRYLRMWEAADTAGLASLLREDAIYSMPPLPTWYSGRSAIRKFFDTVLFSGPAWERYRLLPVRANGGPAFAVYQRDASGVYRPVSIQLVLTAGGQVAQVHAFLDAGGRIFARFKLPEAL